MHRSPLTAALVAIVALSAPTVSTVFAQNTADSASGKRFSFTGSVSLYEPSKNS